jgi:DNA-binding PadR family transcriptional regulator
MNDTQGMILGFLSLGIPMNGGELNRAAQQPEIREFWSSTKSQVYREIDNLLEAKLVKARARGPRNGRPVQITAKGLKAYRAWLERDGKVLIRDGVKLRKHFRGLGATG